jgi:hypothetical protein
MPRLLRLLLDGVAVACVLLALLAIVALSSPDRGPRPGVAIERRT